MSTRYAAKFGPNLENTRYAAKFGPNLENTRRAIREARPFNAGNLYARFGAGHPWGSELPPVWRDDYQESRDAGAIVYTVYSYQTPIAWLLDTGVWVVPMVSYSVTTSAHQGQVRHALRVRWDSVTTGRHVIRTHTQASTRRARELFGEANPRLDVLAKGVRA